MKAFNIWWKQYNWCKRLYVVTRLRSLKLKNKTLLTKRTEKRNRHTMGPKRTSPFKNGKLTMRKKYRLFCHKRMFWITLKCITFVYSFNAKVVINNSVKIHRSRKRDSWCSGYLWQVVKSQWSTKYCWENYELINRKPTKHRSIPRFTIFEKKK